MRIRESLLLKTAALIMWFCRGGLFFYTLLWKLRQKSIYKRKSDTFLTYVAEYSIYRGQSYLREQ